MKPIHDRLERIESEEKIILPNAEGTGTRTLTLKVPAWRDPKDGEIYLDADSFALIDKAKARHLGVLAPQELAKLRERLGLTQQEIAGLLQIGEKTWSRWETGREIPSRSLNLLLLALYEGKIDVAYLRAKQATETQPAPEPVLRARGWHYLVQTQRPLVWLESQLLAQEDWSLALGDPAIVHVMSSLWVAGWTAPASGSSESITALQRRVEAASVSPRTEKMPLCA